MADFEVSDIANVGVFKDVPGFQLPPEAWTMGENVRFMSDSVERMAGWQRAFPSTVLTGNPIFAVQLHTPTGQIWWLYASATDMYVLNESGIETDVSRAANYSTSPYWQSTFLGGVPIMNNTIDVPQFWASYNLTTDFADLSNWPANERCDVIRAFGPYLVALAPTIAGTKFPHLVHWSHPADPGSIPISWDETDPTRDCGKNDLADTESGGILDGLPLRTSMCIYKEHSTWLMRPVGGQFIFQFDQFLTRSGLLARNCVGLTGDGAYHFVVTQDDIVVHDGSSVTPLLSKRMRRYLFNQIDDVSRTKAYVFAHPRQKEMWFVYPEAGHNTVNRALIWNYGASSYGTIYEADYTYPYTALGDIDATSPATWNSMMGITWDTVTGSWNRSDRRLPVGVDTLNKRFLVHDSHTLRDGADFTARVRREQLAVLGLRRSGDPIVDFKDRQFCRKIWPKVSGGKIMVSIGRQDRLDQAVTWSPPIEYDPATSRFVDVTAVGATLSVDFFSTTAESWKLFGYDLELGGGGRY